ncbi:hypothetical protein [Bacillus cereus]|uniref:hypothetical protein n=1 Tax=Bacillus cereus TaxID=1396 RepID=UPI0015CF6DC6|nr:hypothetical protein [Bacillus cereus]
MRERIVYAVVNERKEVVSKWYSRKGDARREKNRWSSRENYTIGTFKVVLTEEEN